MNQFISIDPGNKKCGLLLADIKSGKVIQAGISSPDKFSDLVSLWNKDYKISNEKEYLNVFKNGQSVKFGKCKIDGEMNRARSPPTDAADLSRGCNLNKGELSI